MNRTGIEWCDWTWNPIVGCSAVSTGCQNCYAEAISKRFHLPWGSPVLMEDRLAEPAMVKKPGRVFVCSMSDLGHEGASFFWQDRVFEAMRAAPWHQYLILTKRPENLALELVPEGTWVGVSIENMTWARRWEMLCLWAAIDGAPALRLFVSVEPMLGPVTFKAALRQPEWVIAGPETGRGARSCDGEWIDALADESPCFFDKRKTNWRRREWPVGL